MPPRRGRRDRTRRFESSAFSAFGPVLIILPFCVVALSLIWLLVRLVWDLPLWLFVVAYLAAAVLLFAKPVQALVLAPLLGARRPTPAEREVIDPLWRRLAQANHLRAGAYLLRVLPADEVNAFACGGNLVVVTTYAVRRLPREELLGVLAHELSHHLGMHTVALTIRHWWSLPVVLLARIGYTIENIARAASTSFGRNSPALESTGRFIAALLSVVALPFTASLQIADVLGNLVGHRSELQADQRAVRMGYGRQLEAALRRVIASGPAGGGRAAIGAGGGWRARLAASHPPARTRVAQIAAMRRHPAR